MSNADAVIAALRSGHDALAAQVSGFTDDDLAGPSGAADWDISQVLSHLGSGAEIARATYNAAIDGSAPPGDDFNHSVWDRWNAMSRRERADGFLASDQALVAMLESLDDNTKDTLRITLSFLPAPISLETAARMRLNEFAMHEWDVRAGSDEHAALAADATAALLHGKPDMIGWIGKPDPLDGKELVIAVTTTEPGSDFALRLQAPVSVGFDVPEQPDGTLALPAEAWLRLVTGRLASRYTPDGVVATGAADLDLLRKVFPGY
jgi:uncharacterized protein (TIGR03083 family)